VAKGHVMIYKTLHKKAEYRVTRTTLTSWSELSFSGMVGNSCSTFFSIYVFQDYFICI